MAFHDMTELGSSVNSYDLVSVDRGNVGLWQSIIWQSLASQPTRTILCRVDGILAGGEEGNTGHRDGEINEP
jgi:hypothetical protein